MANLFPPSQANLSSWHLQSLGPSKKPSVGRNFRLCRVRQQYPEVFGTHRLAKTNLRQEMVQTVLYIPLITRLTFEMLRFPLTSHWGERQSLNNPQDT